MAGKIVGMVLRGTPDLDLAEKLVLVVHAEYTRASSGGVSWPSVGTIAKETGLSPRRVKAVRSRLVAKDYLTVVEASRGGPKTTKYRINMLRLAQSNGVASSTVRLSTTVSPAAPFARHPAKGNGVAPDSNGVATSSNGVASSTVTVSPATPEPEVSRISTGIEPEPRARGRAREVDIQTASQKPIERSRQPKTEAEMEASRQRQQALVQERLQADAKGKR